MVGSGWIVYDREWVDSIWQGVGGYYIVGSGWIVYTREWLDSI